MNILCVYVRMICTYIYTRSIYRYIHTYRLGGGWSRSRSAPLQMRLTPPFAVYDFALFVFPSHFFGPRLRGFGVIRRGSVPLLARAPVQGYLAHKKTLTPLGPPRTPLGPFIGLR